MKCAAGKVAGALFFVAASQFVIGLVVAKAQYTGYSISANYISDLGVGPSAMIFNSSVFLMGLLRMRFGEKIYLGLGVGGMERMIVYAILLWGAEFGGCLLADYEKADV